MSSTAKWAMQRPRWKRGSRGSLSRLYCSTASELVWRVKLFLSSKVAMGRAIDEETEVEGEAGLVLAVAELGGLR